MERIKGPEISVTSEAGMVRFLPVMDQRGTPVPTGEGSFMFSETRFLGALPAIRQHLIHLLPAGNWITVRGSVIDEGPTAVLRILGSKSFLPDAIPVVYEANNDWTVHVGRNPALPTEVNFGKPDPLVKVKFTGHSDQVVAQLVHGEVTASPDENLVVETSDVLIRDMFSQRSVVACSEPQSMQVTSGVYNNKTHREEKFSYRATCMVIAEARELKKARPKGGFKTRRDSVRLSVATIADSDNLLRIYHGQWHYARNLDKSQRRMLSLHLAKGVLDANGTEVINPDDYLKQLDLETICGTFNEPHDSSLRPLVRAIHKRIFPLSQNQKK